LCYGSCRTVGAIHESPSMIRVGAIHESPLRHPCENRDPKALYRRIVMQPILLFYPYSDIPAKLIKIPAFAGMTTPSVLSAILFYRLGTKKFYFETVKLILHFSI